MDEVLRANEPTSPVGVLLTKLHPPPGRNHIVVRERLMGSLEQQPGVKLNLVAAPAGCGKTTLLAMWRDREAGKRPIAWLTLDERDNDPIVMWANVFEALRSVCPSLSPSALPLVVGSSALIEVALPHLVNELSSTDDDDVALVLDDFDRLSSGIARDSMSWFIEHSPASFQVVLSSRSEPAVPLSRLRAHGELLEVRAEDLAFTRDEADALLNGRMGLGLAHRDVWNLVERTEGWPAGVYLAALSLGGVVDRAAFVNSFGGATRYVADFFMDEVLSAQDTATQALMLRSSILERFCGSLCDVVVDGEGSAQLLEKIARANLFLVPLDDRGEWYRFHHLFAQLLRVELEHREPGLAATLHRRALSWFQDRALVDEAIEHALAAKAFTEAGELIAEIWVGYANACRSATLIGWLERIPRQVMQEYRPLLIVEAWVNSLEARLEEATAAIEELERRGRLEEGPLPDGFSSLESSLATLRAVIPWGDVGRGYENAVRASQLEGPESPWRSVVCWALAAGSYFRGDLEAADRWYEEASQLAPASEQWLIAASSLAYRSLVVGELGRLDEQASLAEAAVSLAHERGIGDVDGEVYIALGASLVARGRAHEALPQFERGIAVARSWGQPIDLANALLCQALAMRAVGDREAAAEAIAEARTLVEECPDPGTLRQRVESLERSTAKRSELGDTELSERELVVLRLLQSRLSEREIGRELHLSHNTVHSHTRSIYRKLGASSRADAIKRAHDLNLT